VEIKPVSKKWDFLFIILLVGISLLYSYYQVMFMRPWSIHQWRQCDGLSVALNYYYDGMHFFHPSIHFVGPFNDSSACPSEFPVIYYAVAILWKVFGYHEFIFRLVEITIAFAGLYALFKLVKELLNDGLWAILVSIFLFSSPIIAYYGSSFLIDLPAFSFALIAWYFFFKFYRNEKSYDYIIAMLFFMLAGLIKVTALLSFVPIVFAYLIELPGLYAFKRGKKMFKKPLMQGVSLLLVVLAVVAWEKYAIYYNDKHFNSIFLTQILPIWTSTTDERWTIFRALFNVLLPQYFNMPCLVGIMILFLILLLFQKKVNRFLLLLSISVFAGSVIYILLWFRLFNVHDYYLINPLVFIPLILITFLSFLKKEFPAVFNSIKIKIVASVVVIFSVYYCAVHTQIKYHSSYSLAKYSFLLTKEEIGFSDWYNFDYDLRFGELETITPYLRSIGISRTEKVISIPDYSPNISLYLMDQKGFTDMGHSYGDNEEALLKKYCDLGAKYMVVNNEDMLKFQWLKPFISNPVAQYKNIHIYSISNGIGMRIVENIKGRIRGDSAWVSKVAASAKRQEISLDSALTQDADWVLQHEISPRF
jgi:hypothetical protein